MSTTTVLAGQSATRVSTKVEILNTRPSLRGVSLLLADLGALLAAAFLMAAVLPASAAPFLSLSEIACLTIPVALFCAIGLYSKKAAHPAVELRKVVCAVALASIVLASVHRYLERLRYASGHDHRLLISDRLCYLLSDPAARNPDPAGTVAHTCRHHRIRTAGPESDSNSRETQTHRIEAGGHGYDGKSTERIIK